MQPAKALLNRSLARSNRRAALDNSFCPAPALRPGNRQTAHDSAGRLRSVAPASSQHTPPRRRRSEAKTAHDSSGDSGSLTILDFRFLILDSAFGLTEINHLCARYELFCLGFWIRGRRIRVSEDLLWTSRHFRTERSDSPWKSSDWLNRCHVTGLPRSSDGNCCARELQSEQITAPRAGGSQLLM